MDKTTTANTTNITNSKKINNAGMINQGANTTALSNSVISIAPMTNMSVNHFKRFEAKKSFRPSMNLDKNGISKK